MLWPVLWHNFGIITRICSLWERLLVIFTPPAVNWASKHLFACNSMSASLLQMVAQLLASGHYDDVAPQLDAIELQVRMAVRRAMQT